MVIPGVRSRRASQALLVKLDHRHIPFSVRLINVTLTKGVAVSRRIGRG